MTENRLKGLDYLRGLMACSVMLYHFIKWIAGPLGAETLLGKLGIYAVAIFYILSGLTLYLAYQNKITATWISIRSYIIKRLFRIFPMLWVTIITTLIIGAQAFDWLSFFLSMTGLFGFIAPEKGIGTGVWSIGNELVFYSVFPLMILSWKFTNRILFYIISIIAFFAGYYFAFEYLEISKGISSQWPIYVNPFNQMFLFIGGFSIGLLPKPSNPKKHVFTSLIILSALAILFYKVNGDHINLVTGIERVSFSIFSFTLCYGFYFFPWNLPALADNFFSFLGEACYSIYLLHPIVYFLINKIPLKVAGPALLTYSIFGTLLISFLTYNYLEKPMMQLGKKLGG